MSYKSLIVKKENRVLRIILNRPEVRNALNNIVIEELSSVFLNDARDNSVRAVSIQGAGKVFCSGGDLDWLKQEGDLQGKQDDRREKNIGDALKLSSLLESMNNLEKPVLGIVHGAALGGGMGLVSVCDFVLASLDTKFGFSEVRLGLVPAVIGPFVLAKLGESHARALFLSGMHFNAPRAFEIGFIHQVVDSPDKLEGTFQTIAASFTASAPNALKIAKNFLHDLKKSPWEKQHRLAAEILATIRVTDEAKEGIMAFLEKRKANWAD